MVRLCRFRRFYFENPNLDNSFTTIVPRNGKDDIRVATNRPRLNRTLEGRLEEHNRTVTATAGELINEFDQSLLIRRSGPRFIERRIYGVFFNLVRADTIYVGLEQRLELTVFELCTRLRVQRAEGNVLDSAKRVIDVLPEEIHRTLV
ncbi:hypothetical protein [Natrinema salaciae]|uniref:hypothetical protein n=1 Tax=Natrinema salaciae TaxID=1186196 RepID=UPI001587661A|nr:hypothetical protein [Natrinema salaciae]